MFISFELKNLLSESNKIEGVFDNDSLMQATYAWDYLMQATEEGKKALKASHVLKVHKILMLHQRLRPNEKGYFRTVPAWVGNMEGKPWYAVPELINGWATKANQSKTWREIKKDHVDFEKIHPFVDGNGRTGRILMNWQLIRNKKKLKTIYDAEKQEYYKWFR